MQYTLDANGRPDPGSLPPPFGTDEPRFFMVRDPSRLSTATSPTRREFWFWDQARSLYVYGWGNLKEFPAAWESSIDPPLAHVQRLLQKNGYLAAGLIAKEIEDPPVDPTELHILDGPREPPFEGLPVRLIAEYPVSDELAIGVLVPASGPAVPSFSSSGTASTPDGSSSAGLHERQADEPEPPGAEHQQPGASPGAGDVTWATGTSGLPIAVDQVLTGIDQAQEWDDIQLAFSQAQALTLELSRQLDVIFDVDPLSDGERALLAGFKAVLDQLSADIAQILNSPEPVETRSALGRLGAVREFLIPVMATEGFSRLADVAIAGVL